MSNPVIIDGKAIATAILAKVKQKIQEINWQNKISLAVVLVGSDPASQAYVRRKQAAATQVGIGCEIFNFPENIKTKELMQHIQDIQSREHIAGLIVQFPLPDSIWVATRLITSVIDPLKDVDCLSHRALGQSLMGESNWLPPTVGAIEEIFEFYKIDITGKHVCIVGRGELIGKPLVAYLLNKPVTLMVCGRSTQPLAKFTSQADIVISGVGKPGLIGADEIKEGAIVIDAATVYQNGKVKGDCVFEDIKNKASFITPVPGGVGPITVAKLFENVLKAALIQKAN
jgi:methylenetetrahydrofolate dehydrogenase (NADP+)/methenyltetrahydrofolate cyclohydrolase